MASANFAQQVEQPASQVDAQQEDHLRIELHAWPRADDWGEDEHALVATLGDRLSNPHDALVEVSFALTSEPNDVARALREMAAALEGPTGSALMNLPRPEEENRPREVDGIQLFDRHGDFLQWADARAEI